jgi:hypothetical protein
VSTTRYLPGPVARFREHLRAIRRLAGDTHDQTATMTAEIKALRAELNGHLTQLVELLRFALAQTPRRVQQLRHLRETPRYAGVYTDPDPLVSILIPTYDNYEMLGTRAIPSALAQTYENIEILVVGDCAPEQTREVVDGFDDPRVSFFNLPYRGPYPADPHVLWLVAGTSPVNEAVGRAKGSWIALLDDDDAFRPDHIGLLLRHAQSEGHELAYACLDQHLPGGQSARLGRFPPVLGHFGMQAALWHAGLGEIFAYELAGGALGLPVDWGLCRRMMEAGVRIGFLDQVTADYYPSSHWRPGTYTAQ